MGAMIAVAALLGLGVAAAGAVGAHMVAVEADSWDAALLYGFVHTLAALGIGLAPVHGWLFAASGWAFLAGVFLFSGLQIAMALTGGEASPLDAFSLLVPVGGAAFMAGWLLLGIAALAQRRIA